MNIGTPVGTYVAFTENAEILYTGLYSGYGYLIDVWLPNAKVQLRLGHLSEILVNKGDRIPARTPVGRTGGMEGHPGAGSSTGPHLHIEADTVKGRGDYGGSGDPSPYVKYLILSKTGGSQVTPSGDTTSISSQTPELGLGPNPNNENPPSQGNSSSITGSSSKSSSPSSVSTYASYEKGGDDSNTIVVTLPDRYYQSGSESSSLPILAMNSKSILNSYYKSQLVGFLYKQG